jgi:hypothetical protein
MRGPDWSEARRATARSQMMAERVGFEPTVELPPRRISSAVLSTTQPPLRVFGRRSILLRGRFHNLAAPLAQEGSLPVCCQTGPNRQFGLTHDPVSRISRPECGVGLPAPLAFVWANRRSGSPAGFTRQCPPMDPADSFRLAKRRPAARREPDEHERTKDVRSH